MNDAKYTRDQKRRAVQEIVKRLAEFEGAIRLIRQFDICEQDVMEYLNPQQMTSDPALTNSLAYDPYTGQPISGWPHVEQRVKSLSKSTFDQAVEEATELRTRAIVLEMARLKQGMSTVPPANLKSYTDWA